MIWFEIEGQFSFWPEAIGLLLLVALRATFLSRPLLYTLHIISDFFKYNRPYTKYFTNDIFDVLLLLGSLVCISRFPLTSSSMFVRSVKKRWPSPSRCRRSNRLRLKQTCFSYGDYFIFCIREKII